MEMKDPYQKLYESISKAFIKLSDMIVWIAKRTLSVKDFEKFIKEFAESSTATPKTDTVKVVRCKNCKERIGCTIYLEAVEADNEDWFCASGVPKEGDDHEETVVGG